MNTVLSTFSSTNFNFSVSKKKNPNQQFPILYHLWRFVVMAASSSGGLTLKLHSLVILNISDHFTRVKSQLQHPSSLSNGGESSPPSRVYGCIIGIQQGRTVEYLKVLNFFMILLLILLIVVFSRKNKNFVSAYF